MKKLLWKYTEYLKALVKWLVIAIIIGILCGFIGTAFHKGVEYVSEFREMNPWLLYLLPAAGLVIVAVYKLTKTEGQNTNDVIDTVSGGKHLSIWLIPAIFVGTIMTHLCGGSSGREGAALQMGGDIGYQVGRLFHLDDRDRRTVSQCGMAAFFSALFGTPLAATMFALMVESVGTIYHVAFIPALVASLVSFGVSVLLGVAPTRFITAAPAVSMPMMFRVALLAVLCALVSVLFVEALHTSEHLFAKYFKNPWIRIVVGGVLVILLTLLFGTRDYNGAGMNIISAAIQDGSAHPEAFLLKIILTAVTLGAGYKGGEVVPAFFVGAVFGCVAGPLLGIPAGFAAALGLIFVFGAATNCPISSIFLSIELFGSEGMLFFALGSGISYMLSGYNGLYSSQKILYSKVKAQYISVNTNHHHLGDIPLDKGTCEKKDSEEFK